NKIMAKKELSMNTKEELLLPSKRSVDRRSFMKGGLLAGGAVMGAGLLAKGTLARAQSGGGGSLNAGDVAILQFLAAAELIEADLWTQYAELGGIGNNPPIEIDPNQPLNNYQIALSNLDGDGPQYITSNTLDEVSHASFLNAYLQSRGAAPVDFTKFETLPGSTATGSSGKLRLTNLMQLTVDTSWYVRYRTAANPDKGASFSQALTLQNVYAIPRNNDDFNGASNPNFPGNDHVQAIANVAGFHFGYIEQGGSSLYAAMSQKVTDPEVLEITLGIGGDEIAHFLEWVDFAGNGVQAPVAPFTDSISGLSFPNFFKPLKKRTQPSLIFPVPFEFKGDLPHVAMIRPLTDKFGGAVATIKSFTADGLFIGQSQEFLNLLNTMAVAADAAVRS
ncbi:MAG: ferritin-like domain-containing protein, partial [Terriglobales bacterium]